MLKFIVASVLMIHSAFAVTIEFTGPCNSMPFMSHNVKISNYDTLGSLTIDVLENFEIPYQGTEKGINQILNSPIGLDSMEVLSDNEMLAYGWCFEVDGVITENYPDEVSLKGVKHIHWFYGYAHFLNGKWIAQCLKSHLRRSPFICKDLTY